MVGSLKMNDLTGILLIVNASLVLYSFPVFLLEGFQKDIIPSNFASQVN